MYWIDTHFHLSEHLPDIGKYVGECAEQNVRGMILCTGSEEEAKTAQKAAALYPGLYYAVGVHPLDIADKRSFLDSLDSFVSDPKCIAAGEIGLDYYYEAAGRNEQLEIFSMQLDRALRWHLPAIVHCRDQADSDFAYADAYVLLKPFAEQGGTFVLHCFAGTPEYARKFMALGAYFGVGGMLTFNKADNIRELASLLPLERLLLETDSPYLAPKPYRGKPNHSKYIPLIGEKLASVKGIAMEECQTAVFSNTCRLFAAAGFPEPQYE